MERQTEADAGVVAVVRFTRARFVNEFGMAWEERLMDGRKIGDCFGFWVGEK